MNFLMKLTRNALWWGDGRKGEKLFFSSRITAGGVREEKNISVGAQTNAVHLASTMRRTLIDPGGELTALLALPCQISCGVCPQTCPLTHPSKTPVSQEWGRWGSGIRAFWFCFAMNSPAFIWLECQIESSPSAPQLGNPSGIQNACVCACVCTRRDTRALGCLHADAYLRLRYHLHLTQGPDLKYDEFWQLFTDTYVFTKPDILLQRVSTCPFQSIPYLPTHQRQFLIIIPTDALCLFLNFMNEIIEYNQEVCILLCFTPFTRMVWRAAHATAYASSTFLFTVK